MITPEQVVVKKDNPDLAKYETRIDAVIKKDWYEGEKRGVNMIVNHYSELIDSPIITEMLKRYRAVGWKCRAFGFTSILFFCPQRTSTTKDSSPGKKRWWFW